jgi:hypothetical protein
MTDLARYPRALILADAQNTWLNSLAMEIKKQCLDRGDAGDVRRGGGRAFQVEAGE